MIIFSTSTWKTLKRIKRNWETKFEPASLQEFLDAGSKCGFGHSTNDHIFLLTIDKDQERWNASNSVLGCDWRTIISIQLEAIELPSILLWEFTEYWMDHTAGPTPWSPKLNQNRPISLKDKWLPCSISHSRNIKSSLLNFRNNATTLAKNQRVSGTQRRRGSVRRQLDPEAWETRKGARSPASGESKWWRWRQRVRERRSEMIGKRRESDGFRNGRHRKSDN